MDNKYKLNYKFSPPDKNDIKLNVPLRSSSSLPSVVSLKEHWGDLLDQGSLGSCTSNTVAGCIRYCVLKNNNKLFHPSRLFIYYNGRCLPGYDVNQDTGLFIRDGYKSVNKNRVCTEELWEYDISKFTVKPPNKTYKQATELNNHFTYFNVNQDLFTIKSCLAEGYPISFGLILYDSFMTEQVKKTGQVPLPNVYIENIIGGHAITIVGYDDKKKIFTIANSWSTDWGDKGFCYIPYDYILDPSFASDFWTVRVYDINETQNKQNIMNNEIEQFINKDSVRNCIQNNYMDKIKEIVEDMIKESIENILKQYLK